MVGVVAHQRRHVEIHRKPRLSLSDQILKTPISVGTGTKAGDLAHRPQAPAIHRRVRATRKGILTRQADILERGLGAVERGIHTLERQP